MVQAGKCYTKLWLFLARSTRAEFPMGVCSIQGVSHPQLAISLHTTLEAGSP